MGTFRRKLRQRYRRALAVDNNIIHVLLSCNRVCYSTYVDKKMYNIVIIKSMSKYLYFYGTMQLTQRSRRSSADKDDHVSVQRRV